MPHKEVIGPVYVPRVNTLVRIYRIYCVAPHSLNCVLIPKKYTFSSQMRGLYSVAEKLSQPEQLSSGLDSEVFVFSFHLQVPGFGALSFPSCKQKKTVKLLFLYPLLAFTMVGDVVRLVASG